MAEYVQRNWRTTVAGVVIVFAGLIAADDSFTPRERKVAQYIVYAANAAGLVFAQDAKKR